MGSATKEFEALISPERTTNEHATSIWEDAPRPEASFRHDFAQPDGAERYSVEIAFNIHRHERGRLQAAAPKKSCVEYYHYYRTGNQVKLFRAHAFIIPHSSHWIEIRGAIPGCTGTHRGTGESEAKYLFLVLCRNEYDLITICSIPISFCVYVGHVRSRGVPTDEPEM